MLGFLALLFGAAAGQAPPDVAEILKKVGETYKGVSQYELVAEGTLKMPGKTGAPVHVHTRVAFRAPNRYRLEGTIPGLSEENSNFDESVAVYDGSALWFYLPKSNQYASIPADKLAADDEGSAHTPQAMDQVAMQKYRVAADFIVGATFLRDDEIELAGAKVSCYVVSVPEEWPGPYTWWIDKETHRILREDKSDGSTVYTTIRLGEPLPDSLFRFEPPPGARRLDLNLP
jgi:outer membrane lipoprotein-sorting protein